MKAEMKRILWIMAMAVMGFAACQDNEGPDYTKPAVGEAPDFIDSRDGKIYMRVAAGSVQNLKPELVTEAFVRYLGMDAEEVTFTHHRLETFAESENTEGKMILVPLDALGTEIV